MAQGVVRLSSAVRGYEAEGFLIHRPVREMRSLGALAPGVDGLLDRLVR